MPFYKNVKKNQPNEAIDILVGDRWMMTSCDPANPSWQASKFALVAEHTVV